MGDTKPQPLLLVYSLHLTLEDAKKDLLAIRLQETPGLGAKVEISCSGLSSGVTLSEQTSAQGSGSGALGKDQGEHLQLQLYTEAESLPPQHSCYSPASRHASEQVPSPCQHC